MSTSPKVSSITLSYNQGEKLIRCIESLYEQECIDEILILENFSTDENMDDIYERVKKIPKPNHPVDLIIEVATEHHNFSEGQNWGIEKAKNDILLLMNNDAAFMEPNTLQSSVDLLLADPEVGLVGSKIFNLDGTLNHMGIFTYVGCGMNAHNHFGRDKDPNEPYYNVITDCMAVTAACVIFKKTDIRFDNEYWFDLEDMDFCFQHVEAGKKVICNPKCLVLHEEQSSRKSTYKDPEWIKKYEEGKKYFGKRWKHRKYKHYKKSLFFNIFDFKESYIVAWKITNAIGIPAALAAIYLLGIIKPIIITALVYVAAQEITKLAVKPFQDKIPPEHYWKLISLVAAIPATLAAFLTGIIIHCAVIIAAFHAVQVLNRFGLLLFQKILTKYFIHKTPIIYRKNK